MAQPVEAACSWKQRQGNSNYASECCGVLLAPGNASEAIASQSWCSCWAMRLALLPDARLCAPGCLA